MINLSKRLQAIHDLVDKGSIVADIGSDHGLLACSLIASKTAPYVYACDVAKGPLAHAQSTISAYAMEAQIKPVLSDGLNQLDETIDTLVIAGMGSDTILHILDADYQKVCKCNYLIIQSNTHVDDIRRWISDHHLRIVDEIMVEETHFYQIIKVKLEESDSLSEEDILFGTKIHDKQIFLAYWNFRLNNLNHILDQTTSLHRCYQQNIILRQQIIKKITSLT
ncbi:MAG: class I SAM-dependent methyltransferase [Erysipelotrichaceae bacterium]